MVFWNNQYTRLWQMKEGGPVLHSEIALAAMSLKQGEAVLESYMPNSVLTSFQDGDDWCLTYVPCGGDPFLFMEDEVIVRLLDCRAVEIMVDAMVALRPEDAAFVKCHAILQCEGGIELCGS